MLLKASRSDLADSALHAPQAGYGDEDFYPDVIDKAAVLTCRLAWNHPLPDGNKRAAWAALVMFIDLNGGRWHPDPPDVDDAEAAMLAVAAHTVDEAWFASWLDTRVTSVHAHRGANDLMRRSLRQTSASPTRKAQAPPDRTVPMLRASLVHRSGQVET